ncbi:TMEM165/GDT1 family protein [Microbacteriaceae bacterium VKM Ac-2854]|nr:TMEM165/GDT1 family protein [Microbacteriaceae bacterium VKM Ac-2854]
MSEQTDIDPNHPAAYQRGFEGRVIPPMEPQSRRSRRALEQPEQPPAVTASRDPVEPVEPVEPAEPSRAAAPESPAARTRPLWILVGVALALLVAGIAAAWSGSSINYQQWNEGTAGPSVEDTVTASLLTTIAPALMTVGLAGIAVVLVVLSLRSRR